jgi:carbon monoxide dehydrogenase subunit G
MRLTNEVVINRPAPEVFDTLLNVERVAGCLPGSRLIGKDGEDTYRGEVTVRIGPLTAAYAGSVRFLSVDREARTATLKASGKERSGQGNADAHVTARVLAEGDGAKVALDTDLLVRGKVAQFGRGVIGDVSQRLMDQFATNVERMLSDEPEPSASQPVQAPEPVDGLGLVVLPMLKRAAPYAVAAGLGLLAGLGLRRSPRTIEIVLKLDRAC